MADIAIFRINYKSDFILTLQSDAGWITPFCIKFWTGAPSQAYYAYYDGMSYTHCTPVEGEPTKLLVQFDDHHLPIGDLKFQIGYHFTVADFPTSVEDEVINQASVIIEVDDAPAQVMLDFNGETAPEIQFALPAYVNEAQRIANEQARIAAEEQRISNEEARIAAEQERQQNEQQRISREQQRIEQEQQRVNAEAERVSEFASLKTESEAATAAANIAATLANEKAQLADDKAALAQAAATLANEKAQLAADKAALAQAAATLANEKAEYAQEQGDAAKTEAEAAHSLNEEVSHDEATRQQQETARQQAEAQRVIDFNAQMQQQQTAYTNAEAVRDTAFDEAETERDAKVDEKVADITNLQAQLGYFICDTASATAAKTITATGYALTTGGNIRIKMTNANTVNNATLNINSTGDKPLFYEGGRASSTNTWAANDVLEIYYDGTNYRANNVSPTFKTGEKVNSVGVDDEPTAGSDNLVKSGGIVNRYGDYQEDPENLYVLEDSNNRIILLIKKDGDVVFGAGVPTQVKNHLQNALETVKVDYGYYEEGQDYLYVLLDNNNKVIAYFGTDSNLHVNGEIYSPTIDYLRNKISNQKTHILNIANSDKIAIVGDSYTQSCNCVKGKSYIAKLSLFSDYIFSNFGVSGDIYVGRMNAIRGKTPANGSIPIDEQGIKYAMMCCYTNDIKYMSDNDYILCARQMALFLIGVGINPILCTEYHTKSRKIQIRNGLNCLAKELNIPFYDIASITDLIYNSRSYSPFWGGTHPGTRSNAIESDNYEKYLSALERPMRSLKIFRARTNTYESLDEYMFHSTEDRAKLFNEILVGAIDLVDASNVDNCTTAAQQKNPSEYQKLAENIAVNFENVSLLSAILSTEKKDLKSLKLNISHDSPYLQVMVKDTIAEPYTHYVKLSSFYITFINEPSVGDVYRCEEDGINYTVQGHIIDDNNQYHLLCSPFVSPWNVNTGTLTKVSGDGDDSIAYTYRERGMRVDTISNDTLGHWIEVLPDEDGSYNLFGSNVPSNIIDVDRIDVLLISSSSYNITDVSFEYSGKEKCVHKGDDFVFKSNYYNKNQELLPSSTFGAIGVLDINWNVTPTDTYEGLNGGNVYPIGCNSKVDISENQKLSCEVTTPDTGTAVLELWCRYFPNVYTDGSGNQITETSYDYSDVIVKINGVEVRERVNTHWKIVRFPINVFENAILSLEVSSDKGIEVCYISLKY